MRPIFARDHARCKKAHLRLMLGFRFWLEVAEHIRLQPNPHISIRFHVFIPCGLKRNRLNHTFYCVALQQGVARGGFVMGLTFSGLANAGETQSPSAQNAILIFYTARRHSCRHPLYLCCYPNKGFARLRRACPHRSWEKPWCTVLPPSCWSSSLWGKVVSY